MLSVENSNELLSEGRGREANESAAPNVIIYQKFKLSIGNKKKRNNRFKINQSMGIKEMINYRKQSVRDSLPNKGSINNQLFSSIGSGSIIDHSFEAPPIAIREKRKIGQNKGSIEERSNKIGEALNLNMNNTTRNFSTIINPGGNSSVNVNKHSNQVTTKNQGAVQTNVKLSPINQINTDLKKRLENLNNKETVGKIQLPQDKKFRIKRNKIVDTNAKNTVSNEESKNFNYTQFPKFTSHVLADSKDNDEVIIDQNSIEIIDNKKSMVQNADRTSNEKLTTIVESPKSEKDEKNSNESKSVHLI